MITFSNGYQLDFACGSGALAYTGRGWFWEFPLRWLGKLRPQDLTVVTKTLTVDKRKGNLNWLRPWDSVKLLNNDNVVNSIGLTNPGIDYWVRRCYPIAAKKGYNIALSIQPKNFPEMLYITTKIRDLKFAYVELNLSCPNIKSEGILSIDNRNLKNYFYGKPIVAKLSYNQAMDAKYLEKLSNVSGIEAIHVINSVPWEKIYKRHISPVSRFNGIGFVDAGGLSGPMIRDYALEAVRNVKKYSHLSVIGGGGIANYEDVVCFGHAGADAFSIGSLFLTHPTRPNEIIDKYRKIQKDTTKFKGGWANCGIE